MPIQRMHRFLISALAVTALYTSTGCSTEAAKPAEAASAHRTHIDSAAGVLVAPTTPYVAGRSGPAALVVRLERDSAGSQTRPADGTCEVAAAPPPAANDAVVWVDGIRQGKPLPQDRRYELVSAGCALSPRMQGVVIGGAINVYNDDVVLHRLIFIRAGTNDTLQTMPFTNGAQLVASDRLTRKAGIVEVRCARHPQERAYIAVFDQPYFGVASAGGTVTLDSVPAGDYQVLTWHEGMAAPISVATKVGATGQTQIVVK